MRKIDVLLIFVLIVEFLFASYCGLIWFKGIDSDVVNDTNVEMKGSCKYTSDYVNTSEIVAKRSERSNLMNEYINKFRVYVNSGRYNFYDVNTLYLIPVGINKCISAGNSKFGLEWEYFFIGVIYTGVNYSYFANSLDDAGCGIDFVDSSTLRADSDGKLLVSKEDLSVDLTDLYNDTKKI